MSNYTVMLQLMKRIFLSIVFACMLSAVIIEPVNANNSAANDMKQTVLQLLAGAEYETEAYIYEANAQGPAVMVVGGIHGNEPAGAMAAEMVKKVALQKGTLIVVPRANKLALKKNVRTLPEITDINRAYPGRPDGNPAERIAFAISSLMQKYQVSMVVDLHEGRNFHYFDKTSVGQTVIHGFDDKSAFLALDSINLINQQLPEKHKKFTFLSSPTRGSTAYYASTELNIPAFTIETSVKQPIDHRVNQHVTIVKFLLASEGLISE